MSQGWVYVAWCCLRVYIWIWGRGIVGGKVFVHLKYSSSRVLFILVYCWVVQQLWKLITIHLQLSILDLYCRIMQLWSLREKVKSQGINNCYFTFCQTSLGVHYAIFSYCKIRWKFNRECRKTWNWVEFKLSDKSILIPVIFLIYFVNKQRADKKGDMMEANNWKNWSSCWVLSQSEAGLPHNKHTWLVRLWLANLQLSSVHLIPWLSIQCGLCT